MQRFLSIFTLLCFLTTAEAGVYPVYAQNFVLPAPGTMVAVSPPFNPPILKGLKIHSNDPFKFDFILSSPNALIGDPQQEQLKQQSIKLIKYFLAGLTIPEKDLWVNLSPYEKNRIVPDAVGQTALGRDLLAEDYILKQITASLIYPEGETGKKFWKRIYAQAAQKFGTTNIPVNTFNKVWIVPDKAVVYENPKAGTAYVVEAKLKVMLEEDYLSTQKHQTTSTPGVEVVSQILREVVIPELTKEVNQGQNFSQLRQVYNSLILAAWYKNKIKDSILEQVYADKKKVAGILSSPNALIGDPPHIYQQYLKAFKKGAYNYIKEETNPITQQPVPRKYFSGGMSYLNLDHDLQYTDENHAMIAGVHDHAMLVHAALKIIRRLEARVRVSDNNELLPLAYNTGENLNKGSGEMNDIFVAIMPDGEKVAVKVAKIEYEVNHINQEERKLLELRDFKGPRYYGRVRIKVNGKERVGLAMEIIDGVDVDTIEKSGAPFLITEKHVASFQELLNQLRANQKSFLGINLGNFILTRSGEVRPTDMYVVRGRLDTDIFWVLEKVKNFAKETEPDRAMKSISSGMKKKIVDYMMAPKDHGLQELIDYGIETLGFRDKDGGDFFTVLRRLTEDARGQHAFRLANGGWTSFISTFHEDGTPTGRVKSFWAVREDKDWYKCACAYIFTSNGKLLLQIRKDGKLEATAAGVIDIGLDGDGGARKELEEEARLSLGDRELHTVPGFFRYKFDPGQEEKLHDDGIYYGDAESRREIYDLFTATLSPQVEGSWRRHIARRRPIMSWDEYMQNKAKMMQDHRSISKDVLGMVEVDPQALIRYYSARTPDQKEILSHGLRATLAFDNFRDELSRQAPIWSAERLMEKLNHILDSYPDDPIAMDLRSKMAQFNAYDQHVLLLNLRTLVTRFIMPFENYGPSYPPQVRDHFLRTLGRVMLRTVDRGRTRSEVIWSKDDDSFLRQFRPLYRIDPGHRHTLSQLVIDAGLNLFEEYFQATADAQKESVIKDYVNDIFPLRDNPSALLRLLRQRAAPDRDFEKDLRKKIAATTAIPLDNIFFVSPQDPLIKQLLLGPSAQANFRKDLQDAQGNTVPMMTLTRNLNDLELFLDAAHETSHAREHSEFTSKYNVEFYRVLNEGSQLFRECDVLTGWMQEPEFQKKFGTIFPSRQAIMSFLINRMLQYNAKNSYIYQFETLFFASILQFIGKGEDGLLDSVVRSFTDHGDETPLINAVGPRRYKALRDFINTTQGQFEFAADAPSGALQALEIQLNVASGVLFWGRGRDFNDAEVQKLEALAQVFAQARYNILVYLHGHPGIQPQVYNATAIINAVESWFKDGFSDQELQQRLWIIILGHRTDKAMYGGIDFKGIASSLKSAKASESIGFHIDPAMLKQLQDATGFVPVITGLETLHDLRGFLETPVV